MALCIDWGLLSTVCLIFGLTHSDFSTSLGGWGRVAGLLVAVVYFGLFNSSITGGRTAGKYLAGIRVSDQSGIPIGLPRSLLRSSALVLLLWSPSALWSTWPFSALGATVESVRSALSLVSVLLVLFWRPSRQGLHDLVARSWVVSDDAPQPSVLPTVARKQLVIAGATGVTLVLLGAVVLSVLLS
ncbi:MAG: RDD family protein, partial [bacterium]|nr:RDD family protein [bacterium]